MPSVRDKSFESRFQAIGTSWRISFPGMDSGSSEPIIAAIKERIDGFDKAYSRFRDDSLVARMAKEAGIYRLPDDAKTMMGIYRDMYELTGGRVTPLIGQVISDAGYDAAYSLKPKIDVTPAKDWDEVMSYSYPRMTMNEPALLDFGAVGKGYLVDIVAGLITDRGAESFTIDAGGDIRHIDASGKPIKVGLEDPDDGNKAIGIAELPSGMSIAGSAGNRRKWDKYTHIIDAKTAVSPGHIKAVWAVARSTAVADAMATALYFAEPERLRQRFSFEYALVAADRSARKSDGFPGSFF